MVADLRKETCEQVFPTLWGTKVDVWIMGESDVLRVGGTTGNTLWPWGISTLAGLPLSHGTCVAQ